MKQDEFFTLKQLSKYLQRSYESLETDIKKKRFPYYRIGNGKSGAIRVKKSDIDAWLLSLTIPAKEKK